jgi:pimeloyl-ACP methyl ester carboxylesterase
MKATWFPSVPEADGLYERCVGGPSEVLSETSDDHCRFRRVTLLKYLAVISIFFGLAIAESPVFAQTAQQPPIVQRPILFVHGWCGDSDGWQTLRTGLASDLHRDYPTLYENVDNYDAYYNGTSVVFIKTADGSQMSESDVPADARFFTIKFYDPIGVTYGLFGTTINHFDGRFVAEISILNKADELAHVIGAIARITKIKDLIVVAHSMGGLVARAYIENLAIRSLGRCTDLDQYSSCFNEQRTKYTQDISRIITLDTPHSGVVLANFINKLLKAD